MTHLEIVQKLVGDIQPAGESNIDAQRFENLKVMCGLVNELVIEIDKVACNKDRQEFSMKQMGEYASNFMTQTLGVKDDFLLHKPTKK